MARKLGEAMFSQGDIIQLDFNPTLGHEPQKKRPALVISADDFNVRSSLTVVAPITSTFNGYPMHVPLVAEDDAEGCICVEQMRAVDLSARKCSHVGTVCESTFNEVLNRVGAVFGI